MPAENSEAPYEGASVCLGCLLRCRVDGGLGELGQLLVRIAFLGKRFVEQLDCIRQAELLSPGTQGAVAADFVVLNGLGSSQEPCIQSGRSLELLDDFFAFGDDAFDRVAGLATGALADDVEDLLQALNLALSLFLVFCAARAILGSAFKICRSA